MLRNMVLRRHQPGTLLFLSWNPVTAAWPHHCGGTPAAEWVPQVRLTTMAVVDDASSEMLGATWVKRASLNSELVATEASLKAYASQKAALQAAISGRRSAQAKLFRFVNKRLEDNYEAIVSLERTILDAEQDREAKLVAYEAEEASVAANSAAEVLAYRDEAAACHSEVRELRAFAEGREALKAELAALHAQRALVEAEAVAEQRSFEIQCEQDRQALVRDAKAAAAKAKKLAVQRATVGLDEATKRRVAVHRRIARELEIQRRETERLERTAAAVRANIAKQRDELKRVTLEQDALARRATVQRRVKKGLKEWYAQNATKVHAAVAAVVVTNDDTQSSDNDDEDCELPQLRPELAALDYPSKPVVAQQQKPVCDDSAAILDHMARLQSPEVRALLEAANTVFPAARLESSADVARAASHHVDAFVARVFDDLHARRYTYDLKPKKRDTLKEEDEDEAADTFCGDALPTSPGYHSSVLSSYGAEESTLPTTVADGSTVQLPRVLAANATFESTLNEKPSITTTIASVAPLDEDNATTKSPPA